jgi:opacity protein-like surface antigen
MLLLTATTDKLQLTTSVATNVDVVAAFVDIDTAEPPVVQNTTGKQLTAISTATTTDIVAAPAASQTRNVKHLTIRNKSTGTSNDVTVIFDANGTDYELIKVTLKAGETLEFIEGIGFYVVGTATPGLENCSTASQTGFSSDTYLTGSNILLPVGAPLVGTTYRLTFDITKTGAGTATPICQLRFGTAGTTADTSRVTFTWGAGTAAADVAKVTIDATFRSVGSGTSAVLVGAARLTNNLASTGFTTVLKNIVTVSSGFDSTVANSYIGASWNGGASAAHTVQMVQAELLV